MDWFLYDIGLRHERVNFLDACFPLILRFFTSHEIYKLKITTGGKQKVAVKSLLF